MATTRLPGIYFETVAPPVPEFLPRMDVAAFAGFLQSGPIGLPFVVEDTDRFQEIFGTDLTLAWDGQGSQMLLAQTPPCVRAYFRNGGKRCWVLRLANNAQSHPTTPPALWAQSNAWTIPGLLQIDSTGQYQAGWVQARSEGSWSDDVTVNATLLESPLPAGSLITSGSVPHVNGLNPGDTVQLYYQATQTWAYHTCSDKRWFWFQAAQQGDVGACGSSPPAAQPDSVTLLGPGTSTPVPFLGFCAQGEEVVLTVTRDTALTVSPGSWLRIELGGRTLLLQVESMEAAGSLLSSPLSTTSPLSASPPSSSELATLISTLGWWVLDPDAAWTTNRANPVQATIVEFELWAMPLDSPTLRIADLGFAPDHPRFWRLLPTDSTLYTPVLKPAPLPYAALSSDIDHPRFPLAGNASTGISLPLGMTALVNNDFTQVASLPGATALHRDGLASFDLGLFLDSRLSGSNSTTLLQDAFALQYQAQIPSQPGGVYALLSIGQPSMLAVPDASLNGWVQNTVQSAILSPPDEFQASEPSASGNYTVSWMAIPGASGYLLQESTDVTFETGVTVNDVGPSLSMSFQNNPGCPEQLYYRASAYGTAGSGPWSGTASIELGTGDFFACSQLPLSAPQLLLFEEPNRVLLEWIPAPGGFDGFTLQIAEDPQFESGYTLYQGSDTGFQYWQVPGPPSYFRINAQLAGASSAWSNTVSTTPVPVSPWIVNQNAVAPLMLSIHAAMLRIAAARGDMMAIFSLPVSYHTDDAVAYPAQLANEIAANESGRILSYGAVYHPWLIVRDTTAPLPLSLRTIPPDGGVCGAIAATTISSGAWIAPANVALTNVVDLQPVLASGVESEFDANQINLIAQEPEGFLIMGQDTLITVEADLEPLNVRRLLILIRRLVLREGTRYVFQNISPTFQRQVARQFEYWMQQLLARGAFAGLSAQDSYQVIADQTVNPPDSIDQGRFIVQLLVAPSVPMRFLTVQLTQSDGQLSLLET
jgi:hypothetical protein